MAKRTKGYCVSVAVPVLSPISHKRIGTRQVHVRCFKTKVNALRKCQAMRRRGGRCTVTKKTR